MTDQLTQDQSRALQDLLTLQTSKDWARSLKGAAGTGKSFILPHLISGLPSGGVAMTAPTNKAVKVVDRFLYRQGVEAEAMTIHKLLGLKVRYRGRETYLEQVGDNLAQDFQYVGVDESSMVSAELFSHIQRAHEDYGTKFFFIGDPFQLPPVNEANSLALRVEGPLLTKPMRQREESHLLGLCTDLRIQMQKGLYKLPYVHQGPGLEVAYSGAFDAIRGLFGAGFEDDPDSVRILAYTNDKVRWYNKTVQAIRYPDLEEPFAVGEPVVFSSPAMQSSKVGDEAGPHDEILFGTEQEGKIMSTPVLAEHPIERIKAWKVAVRSDQGETATVWVLDEEARGDQKTFLDKLAGECKVGKRRWLEFWRAKEAFADLRPLYALTVHKSQGSTFHTTMVDMLDIFNNNRDKQEATRCLYTAVSRASDRMVTNASFPRKFL